MLQIRESTYRGEDGFLICGRDAYGRRAKVFTTTRASAEHIRRKLKAGEEIGVEDFGREGEGDDPER